MIVEQMCYEGYKYLCMLYNRLCNYIPFFVQNVKDKKILKKSLTFKYRYSIIVL